MTEVKTRTGDKAGRLTHRDRTASAIAMRRNHRLHGEDVPNASASELDVALHACRNFVAGIG